MENKINVAKILKDCPKGMELDCTLLEGLEFDDIIDDEYFPIRCRVKNPNGGYNVYNFTKYGCWFDTTFAKCVIFPKGKTTWEGFQRPFKDGDVVVAEDDEYFQLFLLKDLTHSEDYSSYNGYCYFGWDFQCNKLFEKGKWRFNRLATEKEKEKLFQVIKDNGYKWNPKTNTLEKLLRFKVGDRIKYRSGEIVYRIIQITKDSYILDNLCSIPISIEYMYNLVPNKFDITTLVPLESKVLVRNVGVWLPAFWGYYSKEYKYPFVVDGGNTFAQCIPYEGNEHLIGTTNDCDNFYKTWE